MFLICSVLASISVRFLMEKNLGKLNLDYFNHQTYVRRIAILSGGHVVICRVSPYGFVEHSLKLHHKMNRRLKMGKKIVLVAAKNRGLFKN